MRVGIIHKRQDSLQSSEWKATDVSMHLCFLIPGTQVLFTWQALSSSFYLLRRH